MKTVHYVCDICLCVGKHKKAIAVYHPEGDEVHVCKKHLKLVKEAELPWQYIQEGEAIA